MLGVASDADREEIRAAYLRAMRDSHPDQRPDDPEAGERARAANAAWEVLGDPTRRAAYDRLRVVRGAGVERRQGRVARRRPDAAVVEVAYSEERDRYREIVSRSLLRFGVGAFAVGLVLLLALA